MEQPEVLTFDDDMDEADVLVQLQPTITLKYEYNNELLVFPQLSFLAVLQLLVLVQSGANRHAGQFGVEFKHEIGSLLDGPCPQGWH